MDSRVAFIDLETTGIEPYRWDKRKEAFMPWHEIIEIGVVLLSSDGITEFETRVMPEHPERCSVEARRVNGFDVAEWQGAPLLHDAVADLTGFLGSAMLWGNNISFDWEFLHAALLQCGYSEDDIRKRISYRKRDVVSFCLGSIVSKNAPIHPDVKRAAKAAAAIASYDTRKLERDLWLFKEPVPHRAIVGARRSFTLFRKGWGLS